MTNMQPPAAAAGRPKVHFSLVLLVAIVFAVMVVRTAWVGDDSYFTMRTIDNFLHGYGLTWNVDERVQAYTHPLWMLLLLVFQAVTHDAFYTTIAVSLAVSVCAVLVAARAMPALGIGSVAVLSVLVLSKAFVDYSTSGLENPATHLLLALFLLVFLSKRPGNTQKHISLLALIAGLATLNRMDTLLIYMPALGYLGWRHRSWSTARSVLLGFAPFFLWEIFSILYYGFPFPNPAYAKLGIGIAHRDLIEQGYLYFMHSLHHDPVTLTFIAAGLAFALANKAWPQKLVALGILLYLMYVLWIGGDFMSGRYFSAPLLGAVVLLGRNLGELRAEEGLFVFAFVLVPGLVSPTPALTAVPQSSDPLEAAGIADERSTYFISSSLLYDKRNTVEPWDWRVREGIALKDGSTRVAVGATGYEAYFAGPRVHLIDTFGLGDPLLARMPPEKQRVFFIGHFAREVPAGYVETLEQGKNLLKKQDVARYYDKLHLVVSGPLWSLERFAAIWQLNTGQLDSLVWNTRN